MAPKKTERKVENVASLAKKCRELQEQVDTLMSRQYVDDELLARIVALERKLESSKDIMRGESIQKTEGFNGEEIPSHEGGLKMSYADKIVSMRNAVKILNPKLLIDGKHTVHNVAAICGFEVTTPMLDDAYELLGKG